ncbi:hypothetical protein A2U01_0058345, partial [Trifolium medium]|nr:hypothetical protein [Trifolium medium]
MLPPAGMGKGSTWSNEETEVMLRAARTLKALSTKYGKGVKTGMYPSLTEAGALRKKGGGQVGQSGFVLGGLKQHQ